MEPLDPEDEKRLTAALVRVYDDEQQARKLLREIGYPTQPEWRDSGLFWVAVLGELSKGRLVGGLSRLIDVVSTDFPGNTTFLEFKRRLRGDDPPPPPPPPAQRLNPNGSPGPAVVLSVPVEDLSVEALKRRLAEVQAEKARRLPDPVFVLGPDGGKRRLTGLAASTTVADVGRALIAALGVSWPRGPTGAQRHATVERCDTNGQSHPLALDATLLAAGVRAGDVIRVLPVSDHVEGTLNLSSERRSA